MQKAVPVNLVVELEEGNVLANGIDLTGFGRLGQLPLLVVVRPGLLRGALLFGAFHLLVVLLGGGISCGSSPPGRYSLLLGVNILLGNDGRLLGASGVLQIGEKDGGQYDCVAEFHIVLISICENEKYVSLFRFASVVRLSWSQKNYLGTFTNYVLICSISLLKLRISDESELVGQWLVLLLQLQ